MIDIAELSKRFGRVQVLDGIDLSIQPRRVTAIVGPNAAGKTTLLKLMLGLTRPDRGTIRFGGVPIDEDCAWRSRIGYMPQIARFPEHRSARHLLGFLERIRGAAIDPGHALVDAFDLRSALDKPLRTLSGGTRQKINAVIAFGTASEALLLDEPTSGLDPVASGILKQQIAQARDAGSTVIIASHVMSELDELADDVVVLLGGRIEFAGPVEELLAGAREAKLERAIARLMIRRAA
jgi:Cu-processing system ATP-binding protein